MAKYQALNPNSDQTLKVQSDSSFAHSATSHVAPLTVFELSQAQADYPIVFVKDQQTGRFHLVALLGLKPNQNLFVGADGWRGEYIPLQLRSYPLALMHDENQPERQFVAIDIESPRISNTEGEALFDDNGEQTAFLAQLSDLMSLINSQIPATEHFVQQLIEHNLLTPQSLAVTNNQGEEINLTGLYVIDESKFNDLAVSQFNSLKEQHLIMPIYACLFSMQRISRLIALT